MAYRPFKRVLRETSLERKCRWLFGICLTVLISLAFLKVDQVAEKLIEDTILRQGRDHVDLHLMERHWDAWETTADGREFLEAFRRDLLYQSYRADVLALDPEGNKDEWTPLGEVLGPADDIERETLEKLKAEQVAQLKELAAGLVAQDSNSAKDVAGAERLQNTSGKHAGPDFVRPTLRDPKRDDPRRDLRLVSASQRKALIGERAANEVEEETGDGQRANPAGAGAVYWYYQPVYWRDHCAYCHNPPGAAADAFSAADRPIFEEKKLEPPFQVIRVSIPADAPQTAVAWVRAVLLAVGIATVVLAIIALYAIVKFVIVKPLKHLRHVSDEVSRGKTDVRAEIHTNDEFENLGASFNKMLRHLIDAQSELRQANGALDAKVDELAQLNMRLYEMNRLKGDFLANMSHELRTPLNSIIGFSDVLQGIESLTDKQRRYAQNIQKSGRLLLEMINDILDLAKLEAGKMDVRLSEFRIETLVQAHCDLVRSLTEEKNIDLDVDIQPDAPPLYQDQGKVQQILTNLLSNAIKFTPEGGRITVSAYCDPQEMLRLTVADTGVGIAEEDREIIFEKFRQGSAVLGSDGFTREYSGTGLGLSIVKELCKLLGGEISFESELGKGSRFTVILPWVKKGGSRPESPIAARLDDLTRVKRGDLAGAVR